LQLDSRSLSALAKQRTDFLHRMIEAAPHVGRDLDLLQHMAFVIDYADCQLRTSDVNRSDQGLSLSTKPAKIRSYGRIESFH